MCPLPAAIAVLASLSLRLLVLYAHLLKLLERTGMSSIHVACTPCTTCCVSGDCPSSCLRTRGLLSRQALRSGAMFKQYRAWTDDSFDDLSIGNSLGLSWNSRG